LLQECRQLYGSTPKLEQRLDEVGEKQSAAAGQVLQKALSDAQILVMANQYEAALEKLAPASDLVGLVSPALKSEFESLRQQASDGFTRQRVAQVEEHMAAGELAQAETILRQTSMLFPGNRELQGLETVLREETNRRSEAQQALDESQTLFRKADWNRGGELLKKAFTAAERVPKVREQVLASFVQAAETAFEKDWRASEALLHQLAELQPEYTQPTGLQNQITQRKRQEFVNQCLGQAQRLQAGGDLQAALREIERGLSSYADESRLADLRAQIQEQVRQEEEKARLEGARLEQETFVRGVTQRAQSEPGLERRIQILEESLARYPQEPNLQHQLSQARELWKRVTAIVSEARVLEEAKKYEEAIGQLNLLRRVHPQYPELDSDLGRVTQLAEQARAAAKSEWIRGVEGALASADYGRAAELLSEGQSKFAGGREVSELEKKLQDGLKLRAKAQKFIADGRTALGKRKWEKAAGYLMRACEIAADDRAVQEQVFSELLQGCEAALEVDRPSAEMLLARATQIEPNSPLLPAVRAHFESQKREQVIAQHIAAAVRAQSGGDWQGALRQLEQGLSVYPNSARLLQVKLDIETRLRQLEEERQRQQEAERERTRRVELERQRLPAGREVGGPSAKASATELPTPRPTAMTRFGDIPGWSEDTLRAAERQLATFIGPLAKIIVKKAASRTSNPDEFYALLAASLERQADREAFLARKIKSSPSWTMTLSGPGSALGAEPAVPPTAGSGVELTAAVIDRAARLLARHVGPIAWVLAKKAARRADSVRTLYLLLADHVESKSERARFLRDAGFPES
jgi:tetratricopeptide (TPR) repeat protein